MAQKKLLRRELACRAQNFMGSSGRSRSAMPAAGSWPPLPALTIRQREHGADLFRLNAPHRPARHQLMSAIRVDQPVQDALQEYTQAMAAFGCGVNKQYAAIKLYWGHEFEQQNSAGHRCLRHSPHLGILTISLAGTCRIGLYVTPMPTLCHGQDQLIQLLALVLNRYDG